MLPKITEGLIRQHPSEQFSCRGEEYYAEGAVTSLARWGDVLEAKVEGSQPWPYSVRIEFDEGGIFAASCNYPYDWGGWCKHIVAVLLACIERPEAIEERPTMESMLDGLDRDQLRRVLLKLVEMKPSLASAVESQVALLQVVSAKAAAAGSGEPRTRQTALDAAPFRRRVKTVFRSLDHMSSSDAYWHVGEVVEGIRQLVDQASAFAEAGDGRSALTILDAVTEESIAGWETLDDSEGEVSGFFYDLAPAWTEAFLTTELSAEERRAWADKLCGWCEELEDYGMDDAFDTARQAVEQGWDFPPLLAALRRELTEGIEAKLEDLDWSGALTSARLHALERQGRYQDYLNLARAAGRMGSYTLLLVKLGRIDEAVEEGLSSLTGAQEALALAKELREAGALEGALRVGDRGPELRGPSAYLAE